ncbi:EF-hand domain-containing protein [Comamonadaceae bacterium OH2545_COT-014]|nr:EF-hand domain-containing protein [Comamonadaceae bacterium OH2545_COT-014]
MHPHHGWPAAVLAGWLAAAVAPAWAQAATTVPDAGFSEPAATASAPPTPVPAPPAGAASAPARTPSKGEKQALQWFRLLDTNHDGKLSWNEVRTIPWKPLREEFKTADTDSDGYVTPDEIRVLARQRVAERRARKAREQAEAEARRQAGAAAQ